MRDLAAGGHGGCFLARHVIRIARVSQARARHPFTLDEAIGTAADGFRDIREGVHIGQPFRHDEQAACGDLRQAIEHFREGCVQANLEHAVADFDHIGHPRHQHLAEGIAPAPALDGGDAITPTHGRIVVEFQPFAQRETPGLAVIFHDMAFDHLRARLEFIVHAVKLIIDQEGVIARDEGGIGEGVNIRQVRVRHVFQHARCLCDGWRAHGGEGERCCAAEQVSSLKHVLSPVCVRRSLSP